MDDDRSARERLDVDVRFLLANERTLLAWVRTGLALVAVGLAVLQFATDLPARVPVSIMFLLAGSAASVAGWRRYAAADAAIRAARLPAHGRAPQALALAVAFVGIALLLAAVIVGV